jgi:hypothetical protein
MVFGLFKNKAIEAQGAALSSPVNTQRTSPNSTEAVKPNTAPHAEKLDPAVSALHKAPPVTNQEPVYKGDPENQVIVFDMDETTIDSGDKKKIDVEATEKLGRKVEIIPADSKENSFGEEIKYVLRPGVKELFEDLYNKGHKIVLTTRNYKEYANTITKHDPVFKQYVSGVLSRPDFEESAINRDFKKYPNHPDNISLWQKTKSILAKIFIKAPKFVWHKIKGIFTGKPARWDPGKGKLGKYPPNVIDLLAANGNHKLAKLKPARFLIDNQASYHSGNAKDSNTYRYHGREFEDSCQSGDFAVISPNVIRDNHHRASAFHADSEEPLTDSGEYLWVSNVKEAIERGWRDQYKVTTGKDPKV